MFCSNEVMQTDDFIFLHQNSTRCVFFLFSLFVSCFSRSINRCRGNHDFIMYKVVITQLPWSHEKTVTMASLKRHYHLEDIGHSGYGLLLLLQMSPRQTSHPDAPLIPPPPPTHTPRTGPE